MVEILDRIAASLCMDRQDTLRRFQGNGEFFARCLRKFLSDKTFSQLVYAWEEGDSTRVVFCTHTLMGLAGNLGFGRLYRDCMSLYRCLCKEGMPESLIFYRTVCDSYRDVIRVLSETLSADAPPLKPRRRG